MATQIHNLTHEWTELDLAARTRVAEALYGPVEIIVTASAARPAADAIGRVMFPGTRLRAADLRTLPFAAGQHFHCRVHEVRGRAAIATDLSS